MNLYNFFLLILSFTCTLSGALPARGNQCVPVNEDGAALRMRNGAGISLFSDQIRINVVESYREPSLRFPRGGFTVSIVNDYCLYIQVTFHFQNGETYERTIGSRSSAPQAFIPIGVGQGDIIRISIHDYL
jgi:hypothetical protein